MTAKKITLLLGGILGLAFTSLSAQTIKRWQVSIHGKESIQVPMAIDLNGLTQVADSALQLFDITAGKKTLVPFQLEGNTHRTLHWIIEPGKSSSRSYELVQATPSSAPTSGVQTQIHHGVLTIQAQDQPLLQYHAETVYPPKGVDTAFKRSGFIHPLNTPSGAALTRINAPDHYHHWGLWNPWTHVLFEKDTVDFWNLKDRKGTVQFAGFGAIFNGPVYGGFQALHQHVVFKKDGSQQNALNELQTVKIYRPTQTGQRSYIMDITIQLSCATQSPVKLLEYRYGGLGLRATEAWNKDNSTILTSEAKNRKEADGSTARWCIAQGQLNEKYGGLEMMSYPTNYNYPEPLRIWPENANKRGDVFLNFSPTKNKDWLLVPGKIYTLKYRFLVFDESLSAAHAEQAWQAFAHPPTLQFK